MEKNKIVYIGNALSKHGITPTGVEFLTPRLRELGFSVITASSKKNKGLRLLEMIATVIKYKSECNYILIDTYSSQNFWYAVIIGRLSRILKLPYICILRGGNLPERLKSSRKQSDILFKNAHKIVALSGFLYSKFKKYYQNLILIPNIIDIKRLPFCKRETFAPKLLWVRSFSEIYNPMLAIYIQEELQKKYPGAQLCMIGPDKENNLETCKKYAEKNDLNVTFTGKLSKEDWTLLSKKYDIFINTTNFDNTPVSVMEAMALGLPIISTNVGGLPYLIDDNKNGILVPPNSKKHFIEAINYLLLNPTEAKNLALQARKKVEGFDWNVVKEKWKDLLQ